ATKDEIVYASFIDKNLKATSHSIKEQIGLDLSDHQGAISAAIEGEAYSSEYLFGEEKIPVYDILYPAVINDQLVGAVNIAFSMENVNSAINKNMFIILTS